MYASLARAIGGTQNPQYKRRAGQWPQANPGVPLAYGDELMSDLASSDTAVNYITIASMQAGLQASPTNPWVPSSAYNNIYVGAYPAGGSGAFTNVQVAQQLSGGNAIGLLACCNGITAGSGFTQRDGGRIQMKLLTGSIRLAYNPVLSTTLPTNGANPSVGTVATESNYTFGQNYRIMVFIDRQPNGLEIGGTYDLFESQQVASYPSLATAPLNWSKRHRIVQLMDLHGSLGFGEVKDIDIEIPIPESVSVTDYTDSNGTISSISSNALYVYIYAEDNSPTAVETGDVAGGFVPFLKDMNLRLLFMV